MTLFFGLLYVGGATALPKRKIGFWNRLYWPALLGMALHEWAMTAASTDIDGNQKEGRG